MDDRLRSKLASCSACRPFCCEARRAIVWRTSIIPASSDVHNPVHNTSGDCWCDSGRLWTRRIVARKCREQALSAGPIDRNNRFRRALEAMDDLLRRADQAIEDSHRIRDQAREHLGQARAVTAQVRRTVQRARAERVRSRQLEREATDRFGISRKNPPDGPLRAGTDQSAPDQTCAPATRSTDPARSD